MKGILTPSQKDELKTFGYLKIKNVFSLGEVQEILDQIPIIEQSKEAASNTMGIKKIFEEDEKTIRSIMSYHNHNDILDKYTRHPKMLGIIDSVINESYYVSQSKINFKRGNKKGEKRALHRGMGFRGLLDGMIDDSVISAFIYLTKQTKENGAVFGYNWSHEGVTMKDIKNESIIHAHNNHQGHTAKKLSVEIKPEKIEEYENKFPKEYLTGEIGDVLLMDSKLLHASEANTTPHPRGLMITTYNPISNQPSNNDRPQYVNEQYTGPIETYKL